MHINKFLYNCRYQGPLMVALVTMLSCVSRVELDFCDFESKVVVNSLLVPDSVIRVSLSESIPSDKEEIFPAYTNAIVEVFDGQETIPLYHMGKGIFESPKTPVRGHSYHLRIQDRDGGKINATTKIPNQPLIQITPIADKNLVKVTISDDPFEQNFYWIGQKVYSIINETTYYTTYLDIDNIIFDDFNRSETENNDKSKFFSYHFYARLSDYAINGKDISFNLPRNWSNPEDSISSIVYLYVINADEHLDKYLKSALVQYDLRVIGDMPVFHTPMVENKSFMLLPGATDLSEFLPGSFEVFRSQIPGEAFSESRCFSFSNEQ